MKKEKLMKGNKGITLVALVVTIVVLLILAGISLNLVSGENGVITKAQEAKEKTEKARENTFYVINELSQELEGELNKGKEEPETVPYLPSNDFHYDTSTSIENGLVIQDLEGNEYVWVVVPKSLYNNTSYNLNNTRKPASSTDYANIEYCLQQYTSTYRKNTSYSDTWYADADNEGWLTEDEYKTLKNNMLESIYINGGFYVGRYEAGLETTGTNRKENNNKNSDGKYTTPEITPVTKADMYPYTYVTRTQAQNLASSVNSGNRISSLMFGVQWDLVLTFMNKDPRATVDVLTKYGKTIGNYYNSLWEISNKKEKYSVNDGITYINGPYSKSSGARILLTTGAVSNYYVKNIFDIAGNVWEWTNEKTDNENTCTIRGGSYDNSDTDVPAAGRHYQNINDNNALVGFRISLF